MGSLRAAGALNVPVRVALDGGEPGIGRGVSIAGGFFDGLVVLLEEVGVGSGQPEAGVELELGVDKTGRGAAFGIDDTTTRVPGLVVAAGVDEVNGGDVEVAVLVLVLLNPVARERKVFVTGIVGAMRAP